MVVYWLGVVDEIAEESARRETAAAARRETSTSSQVPSAATSVRCDDARVDTAVRGRWTRRHLRSPSPVPTHRVVTADVCGRVRAFISPSRPARPRLPSVSRLIVSALVNARAFWQNVHPRTRVQAGRSEVNTRARKRALGALRRPATPERHRGGVKH